MKGSPAEYGYRNKMEFTFGDEVKDGPLSLGLHKRGGFYDIIMVSDCLIMDEDYRKILAATRDYFEDGIAVFSQIAPYRVFTASACEERDKNRRDSGGACDDRRDRQCGREGRSGSLQKERGSFGGKQGLFTFRV